YQQKGGWLFDIGMAYKALPKFSLYASIRLQRQYNLIIEEKNTINFRFNLAKENNLGKIYKTDMVALRFGICF
ncbi:MAG: hypothetical protein M0P66_03740, partial [Salinivirgaceae bacterium]|nr:hypothetical protein [Salinivirgaceae bacterium]